MNYICIRFETAGEVRVCFTAIILKKKMEALLQYVQDEFVPKKELPSFQAGDTITVYYEIREGAKVRIQFFKGVVIQIKGSGATKTFTIRKMSGTVGVERIFPMNLPAYRK